MGIAPLDWPARRGSGLPRRAAPGLALFAVAILGVGCSEPLTPARAGTIIRHSKAFLSGPPESLPVFDGVTALLPGSEGSRAGQDEGDSYVAEFAYHWPDGAKTGGAGLPGTRLTARIVLGRSGNGWAVDDDRSRELVPTWPRLPAASSSFWPPTPAPMSEREVPK